MARRVRRSPGMVRLERVAGNTTLIDYSRNTSGPTILTSYNVRQGKRGCQIQMISQSQRVSTNATEVNSVGLEADQRARSTTSSYFIMT